VNHGARERNKKRFPTFYRHEVVERLAFFLRPKLNSSFKTPRMTAYESRAGLLSKAVPPAGGTAPGQGPARAYREGPIAERRLSQRVLAAISGEAARLLAKRRAKMSTE
jgi:hypothetical protein